LSNPNITLHAGFPTSITTVSQNTGARIPQSDLDVQATDNDAAVSRSSAVELGYLEDEFAGCFINDGSGRGRERVRRMPVINRGMVHEE
jgi:hypothetical protein